MNKPITEETTLEYADKMLDEARLKAGLVVRKLLKSEAIDLSDYEGTPYIPARLIVRVALEEVATHVLWGNEFDEDLGNLKYFT